MAITWTSTGWPSCRGFCALNRRAASRTHGSTGNAARTRTWIGPRGVATSGCWPGLLIRCQPSPAATMSRAAATIVKKTAWVRRPPWPAITQK